MFCEACFKADWTIERNEASTGVDAYFWMILVSDSGAKRSSLLPSFFPGTFFLEDEPSTKLVRVSEYQTYCNSSISLSLFLFFCVDNFSLHL